MAYRLMTRSTPEEWDDVESQNPLFKQIRVATRKVERALTGRSVCAYLCGPASEDKSDILAAAQAATGIKPVRGDINTVSEVLDLIRDANGRPMVFARCDHLFRSRPALEILMGATDRKTGCLVPMPLPKEPNKPQKREDVRSGPIIFLLNDDLSNDALWPKALRPHIVVLRDREPPAWIDADPEAWWEYSVYPAIRKGMLRQTEDGKKDIPLLIQKAAIADYAETAWRQTRLSRGRLAKIANLMFEHHERKLLAERNGQVYDPRALSEDLEGFLYPNGNTNPGLTTANPASPPYASEIFVTPKQVPAHDAATETALKPKPVTAPAALPSEAPKPEIQGGTLEEPLAAPAAIQRAAPGTDAEPEPEPVAEPVKPKKLKTTTKPKARTEKPATAGETARSQGAEMLASPIAHAMIPNVLGEKRKPGRPRKTAPGTTTSEPH